MGMMQRIFIIQSFIRQTRYSTDLGGSQPNFVL